MVNDKFIRSEITSHVWMDKWDFINSKKIMIIPCDAYDWYYIADHRNILGCVNRFIKVLGFM